MVMENVPLFVQENLMAMFAVIPLADDNAIHPTAWSDVIGVAVDDEAIHLVFPQTASTHQKAHTDELPQAEQKS